jgi:O-antigen/teichoic acid export membrane protein
LKSPNQQGRHEVATHLREIGGGAVVAFILKAVGFGGTLLLSVVAARSLGAAESGLFFLALTVVTVLATVARGGLDKPLVREIAIAQSTGDVLLVRRLASTCLLFVTALSLCIGFLAFQFSPILAANVFEKAELEPYLQCMSWSIPALAISGWAGLAYQGISRISLHLTFFSVATPSIVLAAYGLGDAFGFMSLPQAYVVGSTVTAATGVALWHSMWPWPARLATKEVLAPIAASSRATLAVIVLQLLMTWTPVIVVGALASSEDVASYHVAVRLALLIGFVLIAVNSIAAPKFASLYRTGQRKALEATVVRTTRIAVIAALPIAMCFMIWPEVILQIFGPEFVGRGTLLQILSLGYLVNTATGSVANLLLMTGHEKEYRSISLAGAAFCVVTVLWLTLKFGVIGAACAASATLIFISLAAAEVSRRRLGFSGLGLRAGSADGGNS